KSPVKTSWTARVPPHPGQYRPTELNMKQPNDILVSWGLPATTNSVVAARAAETPAGAAKRAKDSRSVSAARGVPRTVIVLAGVRGPVDGGTGEAQDAPQQR